MPENDKETKLMNDAKTLIGLSDNTQDEQLQTILGLTTAKLKAKLFLSVDESVPEELNFILVEVSIKRFNRLRNEGMDHYSQEDENIVFNSNDFSEFEMDIADWLKNKEDKPATLGNVRFLNPYQEG